MSAARARGAAPVAALVLLVTGLLGACDRFMNADQRLQRAQQKMAAGNYADASLELRELLDRAPGRADAHRLLAEVSLRLGDADRAATELERARRAGADPAATRELEFQILLAAGKLEDLRDAAENDAALPPGRDLAYAAAAETGLGDDELAERHLREAVARAPTDTVVALKWATFLAHRRLFGEADAAVSAVLEREPTAAEGWLLKADVLIAGAHFADARDALQQALTVGTGRLSVPQQVGALTGIAQASMLLHDEAGTQSALAALRSRAPQAAATHFLLGRFALMRKDYASAVVELRRALQTGPPSPQWRLLLAAALFGQGSFEQADVELSSLLVDDPGNDAARKLLAEVYLARDRPEQVRGVLAAAGAAGAPDAQSQWLLGRALVQSGSAGEGVAYLEKSVAADPSNAARLGDLAAAYIVAGERDKALKAIARIPKDALGGRRSALLFFADLYGQDAVHGRAEVERLVGEHRDDSALLALAGSYLARSSDAARARELLVRAIDVDANNVEAHLTLAALEAQQGHLESAETELRTILKIAPGREAAYLGLSELSLRRGDRAGARAHLEQAIGLIPGSVEARLRLARMAFLDGDAARAHALLDQVISVAPGQGPALNAVGLVLFNAGRYDDALARFSEAIERGSPEARLNAARSHAALGHPEQAERLLEAGLAANHSWLPGTAFLAELEARQGRIKDALAAIQQFRLSSGARAAADEMEGDVELIARRFPDAASAFARVAAREPSARLAVKLHYARRAGSLEHPEQPLLQWLAYDPTDNDVRRVLAQYYQSRNERAAAISQYERIVLSDREGDPISLNNLAWLYLETGDLRALETARKAYGMRPDVPDIADTYGWMLVQAGQSREALAVLEEAKQRASDQPEIQYHLAVAYARSGEAVKARALLESVLRSRAAYAWRADAESLLKSLKS